MAEIAFRCLHPSEDYSGKEYKLIMAISERGKQAKEYEIATGLIAHALVNLIKISWQEISGVSTLHVTPFDKEHLLEGDVITRRYETDKEDRDKNS